MAAERYRTVSGTLTNSGDQAHEGPAVDASWEIRDVDVDGPATLRIVEDHDDDNDFTDAGTPTWPWESISDPNGGGLEGRARGLDGGDSGTRTNPLEALEIEADAAGVEYRVCYRKIT